MAVNENIIAAYLDGFITREEANTALGGFSFSDNDLIEEASADNVTIAHIAAGDDPQQWADNLDPLNEFMLPDLPIMAQEADEHDDTHQLVIVDDFADDNIPDISTSDDAQDDFYSDTQQEITSFPNDSDFSDLYDTPDIG